MADQKVVVVSPVNAPGTNCAGDGSIIAVQETVRPFPPAAQPIKTGVKVDSPTDKLV
jgi:hypothetical protein